MDKNMLLQLLDNQNSMNRELEKQKSDNIAFLKAKYDRLVNEYGDFVAQSFPTPILETIAKFKHTMIENGEIASYLSVKTNIGTIYLTFGKYYKPYRTMFDIKNFSIMLKANDEPLYIMEKGRLWIYDYSITDNARDETISVWNNELNMYENILTELNNSIEAIYEEIARKSQELLTKRNNDINGMLATKQEKKIKRKEIIIIVEEVGD